VTDHGKVRLRIAPSPTGDPHVGTAYVALFNLAFARGHEGRFVLRLEDTDRNRLIPGAEEAIYESLRWLGLQWDEGPDVGGPFGPYRQSERLPSYHEQVERLIAAGHAYRCWCSPERLKRVRDEMTAKSLPPKYDRFCLGKSEAERRALGDCSERPVVRMRIPDEGATGFTDLIRGEVGPFEHRLIDDQVILKGDGYPTYHLAVVVDDHLMGITHVARGEEWISSTPKHVLLYDWLGWELPKFAHFPILRNTDRSKVSKRKNPWATLPWFRQEGYLPEALVNFLALMGWSMPDGREVFTFEDIARSFEFERISTTSPVFDLKKLDHFSGLYARAMAPETFLERVLPFVRQAGLELETPDVLRPILPDIQERVTKLTDAAPLVDYLLQEIAPPDRALLLGKRGTPEVVSSWLDAAVEVLSAVEPWEREKIDEALAQLPDRTGAKRGEVFGAIRVATSGKTVALPLDAILLALGRDRAVKRLRTARQVLA
jgi:glutamyl-tRNA synthetase